MTDRKLEATFHPQTLAEAKLWLSVDYQGEELRNWIAGFTIPLEARHPDDHESIKVRVDSEALIAELRATADRIEAGLAATRNVDKQRADAGQGGA